MSEHWPGKRMYDERTGRYIGRYQGQLGSQTLLIHPVRHGVDQLETKRVDRKDVRDGEKP